MELLYDDEVVDHREVQSGQPRDLIHLSLSHVPPAGGLHRVTVQARVPEMDAVEPASVSQIVNVSDDQLPVLYVDRPRYERAAIARALEAARELRVTRMDPAMDGGAGRRRAINWDDYEVVLIGDVEASDFLRADLEALRDLVSVKGRGLAMLGGVRTLGSGRYRDTALREVVPADLSAVGHWPAPVDMVLTPAGRVHPVLQVSGRGDGDADVWQALPPLAGASRLGKVPAAAEVLMQTPAGEPLMAVQEVGQGRAAALAFDSTWQWAFAEPAGLETQRRFWRQLVLWLGDRRPRVWVTADRPRYELGALLAGTERVVLRAGADDAFGDQKQDMVLTGTVIRPDGGQSPVQWVRTADGLEAAFAPREEGEYLVRVMAPDTTGASPAVEAETAFVVESVDIELVNAAADLDTLRTIAERTSPVGGAYFPLEDFGRLLEELRAVGHQNELTTIQRARLVEDYPWVWFTLFIGLVTIEWLLRRRANLV
jgi:uncharacterized membrane protein